MVRSCEKGKVIIYVGRRGEGDILLELGAGAKLFSSNSASSSSSMTRERLALTLAGSVSWLKLAETGTRAGAGAEAATATCFASTVAGVTPMVLPFAAAATAGFAAVAGVHAGAGGALEKKELRLVCPLTGAKVFGGIFEKLGRRSRF